MRVGLFFFFNDTATTEIYTLSLHDALPIWDSLYRLSWTRQHAPVVKSTRSIPRIPVKSAQMLMASRSEEHTSELQSLAYLVCRLLLEKKKKIRSNSDRMRKSIQSTTRLSC